MPFQSNTGKASRSGLIRCSPVVVASSAPATDVPAHVADRVERPGREAAKRVVVGLTRLAAAVEDFDAMTGEIVGHAGVGAIGVAGPDAHRDASFDEGHEVEDRIGQEVHPAGEALAGQVEAAHPVAKMHADRTGEAEPFEGCLESSVGDVGLAHERALQPSPA